METEKQGHCQFICNFMLSIKSSNKKKNIALLPCASLHWCWKSGVHLNSGVSCVIKEEKCNIEICHAQISNNNATLAS